MKIIWIIYNVLWIMSAFFIPIFQSYFATIMFDNEGNFTFELLLRDHKFWIAFALWVVGNIIFLIVKIKADKEVKEDDIIAEKWIKDKAKLIDDVTKKAKRGDYSGAREAMNIMESLDKIVKGDK